MVLCCHNPYFSRRFFAIIQLEKVTNKEKKVTILILVEGSLQFISEYLFFGL